MTIDELNLRDEPVPGLGNLEELPPQDVNFDHMYEAFDDRGCCNAPGVTGEPGASLHVRGSSLVH